MQSKTGRRKICVYRCTYVHWTHLYIEHNAH